MRASLWCRRHVAIALVAIAAVLDEARAAPAPSTVTGAAPIPSAVDTCVVAFIDGPILHVPSSLMPRAACSQTPHAGDGWLTMAFNYPAMTPARGFGAIEIAEAKDRGTWVPQRDAFMVDILTLFYSRPVPNAKSDDWVGPEPQPWQIIANRASIPGGYPEPHIGPSPYAGLKAMQFGDPLPITDQQIRAARSLGIDPRAHGQGYVEMPDADYTLLIDCDSAAIACTGHVHLKDNHVQYRFMIPAEAIVHSTEFIAAMNSMIRSWIAR